MSTFLRKSLKIFFYLALAGVFLVLVDFESLSFKTVVPKPETKVNDSVGVGVIRNVKDSDIELKVDFTGSKEEIVELVNQARKEASLEGVEGNDRLDLSATDKAEHMRDNDYFDHVSPEGLQPWYFAQKRDYDYKAFGENLAEGYFSAESVHEGWMNSPGHRENILSEKFNEIGIGIVEFQQDGLTSYLVVQHFGSQLTSKDLVTEIVCEKDSRDNCEEAEDDEEDIEELIEEQEKIIKEAKKNGIGVKDLNRLEENLEDLKDAEDDIEDYLDECKDFIERCDVFE